MNMSKYAPVIIFAYRRLDTLTQVFEHLIKCSLAIETDVFVYSNAPIGNGKANDEKDVQAVREFINRKKWHKYFKHYSIILRDVNNGPTENMHPAIDEIIIEYGRVIVLEDDIIPMPAFLQFMNGALEYYEKNKNIFSICAYNPVKPSNDLKSDSFLYPAFRSWGYAMWLDRWKQCVFPFNSELFNTVNFFDMHKYAVMYYASVRHAFLTHSGDALRYLDAQLALNALSKQMSVVYPVNSYCDCVGLEKGGETTLNTITITNNNLYKSPKELFMFSQTQIMDRFNKLYLYEFRKKEFATDLYFPIHFDRNYSYYLLYLAMSKILAIGANASIKFSELNIRCVAFYGLGEAADLFYEWFSRMGIKVLWCVDKKVTEFFGLPVIGKINPIEEMPPVDAIIVTAIHYYFDIDEDVSTVTNIRVLSVEDMVYTVLQNRFH